MSIILVLCAIFMNSYSHPKCYAKKTGQCSAKISSEHLISDNILKVFEYNKTVKSAGLPWMQEQSFDLFSRSSLVSNILCTNHNGALSKFDTEAGNLFRCFLEFDSNFNSVEPVNELRKFNGDYIEKWMLKTICGLVASNQIAQNGQRKAVVFKDIYVDILFGNSPWPNHWGLYFKVPDNNQIHKFDCISIMPITAKDQIGAVEFLLNNFAFNLVLGEPSDPAFWGTHRINKIELTDGRVTKVIEFLWEGQQSNLTVSFTRAKTSDEFPSNFEDWMKK